MRRSFTWWLEAGWEASSNSFQDPGQGKQRKAWNVLVLWFGGAEEGKERLPLTLLPFPVGLAGVPIVTLTYYLSFSSTGPESAAAVQLVRPKDGEMGDSEPVNFLVWLLRAVCPAGTLL